MPFFNIFSKKQAKKNKKVKIILDSREKNSLVASELVSLGLEIEFNHLEVADYLVNDIAIERKTISDLKSSIINKRIISQLLSLKQYKKPILIIENFPAKLDNTIIHQNALRGFILSVLLEFNIPIIFTKDSKETAIYISLLAKKTPKNSFSLRASRILETKEEQIQYILEGFPYIGPVKAKKLLEKFGDLKSIITAPEEELKEILGKNSVLFKEFVNHNPKQKDNI